MAWRPFFNFFGPRSRANAAIVPKISESGVTTVDGVLVEELHVKQSLALISKMKMIQSMS